MLVSRHRSDVVGCAQPIPSVLASDATPRCASMASADRQMIRDATLASLSACTWPASALTMPDGVGGELTVACVVAKERNPPAGCKAVPWHLLTNRMASHFAEMLESIASQTPNPKPTARCSRWREQPLADSGAESA
ncbi:hypothetical protein D8B34_20585 [Verminephrobacter eiseniae]|nr:hypothetical protein [Verminephrobacter eiseniae]MCW5295818.1 hypothetical protein [Verminephrobacter eiseniae]MCW8186672.1 hypothetical protein [Verminephrobacter eiseniae]MCW8222851.1 hypothetical protein [Verminephrobacter eiseniae]MCW8236051.1 hypothetical protein [Verminephrobacter eiseniae]